MKIIVLNFRLTCLENYRPLRNLQFNICSLPAINRIIKLHQIYFACSSWHDLDTRIIIIMGGDAVGTITLKIIYFIIIWKGGSRKEGKIWKSNYTRTKSMINIYLVDWSVACTWFCQRCITSGFYTPLSHDYDWLSF